MDAMDSANGNPSPMRETHEIFHNIFTEIQGIFDKFFKALFGVIFFKSTTMGQALFSSYPNAMMSIVFMTVLFFSLWLLGTLLPHRSTIFQLMLVVIMILIATVYSVLVMIIV
ncbi:hypothetical protein Fmac_019073 [Flemingia macrophylla]|uniref:Uncharacterized protein n=1 Tax=Flemingia macrophylla TaxID=520843 RepID=A0ABD1M6U2_9FABA